MLYAPEFSPLIQLHVFAGCFLIMYETIQLLWVWCWGDGLGFNMTTTVICKPRPQTLKKVGAVTYIMRKHPVEKRAPQSGHEVCISHNEAMV